MIIRKILQIDRNAKNHCYFKKKNLTYSSTLLIYFQMRSLAFNICGNRIRDYAKTDNNTFATSGGAEAVFRVCTRKRLMKKIRKNK